MPERPLIAVVGGETLLARELLELLNEAKPAPRLKLISATAAESSAVLTEVEDEPAVMLPLSVESLEGSKLAFLAGSASSSRRTLKVNPPDGPVLVDLSAALEEQPEARLRAPSAEPAPPSGNTRLQVIAHPAAIALAMFFSRLAARAPIRGSLVHVFEPASERGKQGLDELQQQTVSVLTFKKQKKDVFDAQLGFNLLARYGEEALEPLETVEQRLERHLASLLAAWPGVPMPSVRLIQAPVFHGHSFSIWVEFEERHGAKALAKMLAAAGVDVRPDDPPSNAGIAGQSGLSVGAIEEDRNHARAAWFWMVADNLRLASENAIAVSREFL